ncbi:MAG: GGDEF domain-containing protein, partial [Chloroflexi bacterium]
VAGDEILRMVAQLLRENVRRHDIVARYGGEEFAIILPATGCEGAPILGERIRRAVQQAAWPYMPVTISIGGACRDGTMVNATDLLTAADHALYDAKRSGRNRCIVR